MDNFNEVKKAMDSYSKALKKFMKWERFSNRLFAILYLLIGVIAFTLFTSLWVKRCYASPVLKVGVGLGTGIVFPNGEAKAMSTSIKFDIAMAVPISQQWIWSVGIGASVPTGVYPPSPRALTGFGVKLSQSWSLGLGLLYQPTPAYEDKKWSHLISVSAIPSLVVTKTISLGFVIAPGITLSDKDPVWSVALQPVLSFRLPNLW